MVIGACTITLDLAGNGSLKGKRRIVKSIAARLRRDFNVSVAEVGDHEAWQRASLGMVCVSTDAAHAHGLLSRALSSLERMRLDATILDYEIEML